MADFGSSIYIDGDIYALHRVESLARMKSRSQVGPMGPQPTEQLLGRLTRKEATIWPNLSELADSVATKAEQLLNTGLQKCFELYNYHVERESYELEVLNLLTSIQAKASGRALLAAIARSPHWTKIIPYMPTDKDWNNGSNLPHFLQNATCEGLLVRDSEGHIQDPESLGQGHGTLTVVSFITPALRVSSTSARQLLCKSIMKSQIRTNLHKPMKFSCTN